jgi:hypothetical protein
MTKLESILGSYLSVMVLAACLLVMSTLSDLLRIPYQAQLWCAATLSIFALLFVLARFGGFALISLLAVFLFFFLLSRYSLDLSYDGMHYHLPSAIEITQGRNVIYDLGALLWSNIYPSGAWRLTAYIITLAPTPNPDLILNGFATAALFLLLFTLYKRSETNADKRSSYETTLLIALIAFSPVVIGQLFSAMVDGLLCSLFLTVALMLVCRPNEIFGGRFVAICIISLSVLLGSIKTSAVYFLTLVFFGALLYGVIYSDKRRFKEIFALGLISAT